MTAADQKTPGGPASLLTEQQVSVMIKVSVAALRKWRLERRGPPVLKIGRLVRYRERDIEEWLASCAKEP